MNTKHLLRQELHPIAEEVLAFQLTLDNLDQFRNARLSSAVLGDAEAAGVHREEVVIRSTGAAEGTHEMSCLLYSPKNNKSSAAYLHIHGGGYVGGRKEYSDPMNIQIAAMLGVTILAVGYRLAPEHPVPAPLDDCYSALAWLHDRAEYLGIDSRHIAIGGESAGGGLAAALAIRARDEGRYPVCHQHLTYPMLDHRTGTKEHFGDPLVGEFVWTRESNQFGWSCYLGSHRAQAPHVPAMVANMNGLPPAWIFTVSLDLFRDENISYAQRLLAAGVDTELVVMPGACHGFQLLPNTSLRKRYINMHIEALGRALKVT